MYMLIFLIASAIYLLPMAKIFAKAGWNPWLVLLMFIPGVNIILLWVFAYGEWPVLRNRIDVF